jgi:glycosyltransferase involved in cell wall biosynthesis
MNATAPTVSVVVPAYNQAHYLPEALQSILAQSYCDYEIIVVDDASTDATKDVMQQYGDNVRYVYQENQGLAGARNTGIRLARGAYVALLDSDDVWLPCFLQEMMAAVNRDAAATAYYCRAQCMDAEGLLLPQILSVQLPAPDQLYQALLRANFIVPSTVILHRSSATTAGLFDPNFRRLQDWEFWLRLLRAGHRFIGVDQCLVHYRLHDSSLSTDPTGGAKAALALAEKHFGPDHGEPRDWPADKQRIYGGIYSACALTVLVRNQDWETCTKYLRKAFRVDPTLVKSLDLFYELALGTQPLGRRGSRDDLYLNENVNHIEHILTEIFHSPTDPDLFALRRTATNTVNWALSLVAYNTGHYALTRRFLYKTFCGDSTRHRITQAAQILAKSYIKQLVAGLP